MNSKLTILLVSGIFLRLILGFSTFHPDIQAFDLGGQIVASGHVLDLYDYLPSLGSENPLVKQFTQSFFIYPPLIYLFHGIFALFFNLFFPQSFLQDFLLNIGGVLGILGTNLHLLFLKLPYLLFDIPIAYLLMKLFDTPKQKLLAFAFWIFNPVNLYATYMQGQFDVIATFFVVLGLYFIKINKKFSGLDKFDLAALCLGVGMAFKIYPLFLIVVLAAVMGSWGKRLKIAMLGFLPYFLVILPFLPSQGFRSSALVAGQTLKSFYATIPISGGESIILFLASLVFFYLIYFYKKVSTENIWQPFFVILILFFVFTHYHPQWFLWLTPFLLIDLVKSNLKHGVLVAASLVSFIGLLFFFDQSLTLGLFAPVSKELYQGQTLWQILKVNLDTNLMRSILQTLFVGVAAYYLYLYFPKEEKIDQHV